MMPPAGIAAYGRDNPCKKSMRMEVRAKKSLGQHFLTDLSIAQRIADSLTVPLPADAMSASVNANEPETDVLEIGPGMGVLTQYLLQRRDIRLKMVEIDRESVDYLLVHFPQINGALIEADFLKLRLETFFNGRFCIIGNFPYVLASAGMGLGLLGVTLLMGAGAWAVSKQIARLSAMWAKKAVSPFWKDRGEKSDAAAHLAA